MRPRWARKIPHMIPVALILESRVRPEVHRRYCSRDDAVVLGGVESYRQLSHCVDGLDEGVVLLVLHIL